MFTRAHDHVVALGFRRSVCGAALLALGFVSRLQGTPMPPGDPLMAQTAKLMASDEVAGDGFGRVVALSGDGRTAIVGSENAACPGVGIDCGAAYVFVRGNDGVWSEQQRLTPSDAAALYNFGASVALSTDGDTALIGAPFAGPPGADCPAFNCGAGYVFVHSSGQWMEQQKLTGSDAGIGATFGWSVSLSGDGNSALIGAINVPCSGGAPACGAAYVFTRDKDGAWVEQQKLTASDGSQGNYFGRAVALSADGDTGVVGVPFAGCPAGEACGAAYVFIHERGGSWMEQQKLVAPTVAGNAAFGFSVSLSSRGGTALVGEPNHPCESGNEFCGAAYLFVRDKDGWLEQQMLTVGTGIFGYAVSLAAGGRSAVVGDPSADGAEGAVYLFARSGSQWVLQQTLTASERLFGDWFGASTALSAHGREALVGTSNVFNALGAAYVFGK